jgi:hypothetical protein
MNSNLKTAVKTKSLNFKKIAQTRRQRGYNWEDTLVKRFNKTGNWKAIECDIHNRGKIWNGHHINSSI